MHDDSLQFIEQVQPASSKIEDSGWATWATIDELEDINLKTIEDPKPIFVSALLLVKN